MRWLVLAGLGAGLVPAGFAGEVKADAAALARQTADSTLECLEIISSTARNSGAMYYADGIWHSPNQEKSWGTHTAPAAAAAGLWRSGLFDQAPEKKEQLRRWALDTFDRAIKDHRNPDGSFGDKLSPHTMFFLVELAPTYLRMEPVLDAARKEVWKDALVKGVEYMVATGNLFNEKTKRNWYANGNLELDETVLLYYVFKVTGEEKYREMFERQLAFTLSPDKPRWRNFGLHYDDEPGRPDGSDGKGYLAENISGHPGYDGDYTHFQSAMAAKLYVASGDPRILRLVNLFLNQIMQHVDRETWIFDATAGSRHSTAMPLTTPAFTVAALQGNRRLFLADLEVQTQMTFAHYKKAAKEGWIHPGMYRGLNEELVTLLESALQAAEKSPAPAP